MLAIDYDGHHWDDQVQDALTEAARATLAGLLSTTLTARDTRVGEAVRSSLTALLADIQGREQPANG